MFNVLKRLNLSDRWDCLVMAMSADKQKIKNTMENFLDKYEEHIGKYILYNNYQNGINNNGWITWNKGFGLNTQTPIKSK